MNDLEAKEFINDVFKRIIEAKSIEVLEKIPDDVGIPEKNRMKMDTYPKIEFKISHDEIQSLIDNNILKKDSSFAADLTSKLTDPLTKLLYATVWKNGDLKKVKHIVKGVSDIGAGNNDQNEALVFYQFGKYLTKTDGQPIVDQHVIRAFKYYKLTDISLATSVRKIQKITKEQIKEYKEWLISDTLSDKLTDELRNVEDYTYHIDKLLFAAGKSIKLKSQKAKI